MVGAQRSNRCDTCRKRKVKCDEDWPVCGQCKRSNRVCPPRSALKVVDEGAKIRSAMRDGVTPISSDGEDRGSNSSRSITCGTVTHVGRSSRSSGVNSPISLTPSEQLAFDLINSLRVDDNSCGLSVIGEFVREVPRYIGRSEALDSVTACMLATHKHLLLGRPQRWHIHPQLYSNALRKVRRALVDPRNWSSSNTLCATVLMHRIEAMYGLLPNINIKVHAAGLAALHRKRGPPKPGNELEIQAAVDSHISIIQYCIAEQEDCFLASPEWAAVLDERNNRSDTQMIYYRLVRQMAVWPTLVRENLGLWQGDATIDHNAALERTLHVLKELTDIGCDVDELIDDGKTLKVKPAVNQDDLVPIMFDVKYRLAAMLVGHYAMYSIVVHRIFLSQLAVTGNKRRDTGPVGTELLRQCRRIWMFIDYSLSHKPMGLPIMSAVLFLTYHLADGPVARTRIIDLIHELDEFRSAEERWNEEEIGYAVNPLLGLCHNHRNYI